VREVGARRVNFFKGIVASVMLGGVVLAIGGEAMSFDAMWLLAASGVVGLSVGDSILFYALGHLGPHRASLLMSLSPVMTAVGGWLLGEVLSGYQVVGIAFATGGVALVVRFGPAARRRAPKPHTVAVLAGVGAALCQAVGVLLAKRGMEEAGVWTGTLVRLLAATVALGAYAVARGWLRTDLRRLFRRGPLTRLVPAAFIGTFLGLSLMQAGIKLTPSAVASALHSTTPLFALPIAVYFLKERAGPGVILGSFVAVGGVMLLLLS